MYTVTAKVTSLLEADLTWSTAEDWAAAHNFDVIAIVDAVPGLKAINLDLQADGRSVIRTATYESLDSRLAHVSGGDSLALPNLRNPGVFSVEFIEESEPTEKPGIAPADE